jgi:hypothetical protein
VGLFNDFPCVYITMQTLTHGEVYGCSGRDGWDRWWWTGIEGMGSEDIAQRDICVHGITVF